jgi:hypothetical protein
MWGAAMNLIVLLKVLAVVSGQKPDGDCDLASDCSDRPSGEDSQMSCDFKNCTFFSRYPSVYDRTFPTWMFMGCE